MRNHDAAQRMAEAFQKHPVRRTGLRKYCPRCKRGGWIFLFNTTFLGEIKADSIIIWDGKSRGGYDIGADVDLIEPERLFRPTTGCGLDNR